MPFEFSPVCACMRVKKCPKLNGKNLSETFSADRMFHHISTPVFHFRAGLGDFLCTIYRNRKNISSEQKYTKRPQNRPNCHKIYQHIQFQGPPKFSQIGIFGLKIDHLATLLTRMFLKHILTFLCRPCSRGTCISSTSTWRSRWIFWRTFWSGEPRTCFEFDDLKVLLWNSLIQLRLQNESPKQITLNECISLTGHSF
jgi:hypothetical protein